MFETLFTGFLALLVATTILVVIGGFVFLIVGIARESGRVSCLFASIGLGGISFLILGVPFWGPFIPSTTTGTVLGLMGWISLIFVFVMMFSFHHEIGKWFKAREFKRAVKSKTLEVVYEGDRITFRSSKKARRNHPSYRQ